MIFLFFLLNSCFHKYLIGQMIMVFFAREISTRLFRNFLNFIFGFIAYSRDVNQLTFLSSIKNWFLKQFALKVIIRSYEPILILSVPLIDWPIRKMCAFSHRAINRIFRSLISERAFLQWFGKIY